MQKSYIDFLYKVCENTGCTQQRMDSLIYDPENRPSLIKSLGELLLGNVFDKFDLLRYEVTLADLMEHFDPAHYQFFELRMA